MKKAIVRYAAAYETAEGVERLPESRKAAWAAIAADPVGAVATTSAMIAEDPFWDQVPDSHHEWWWQAAITECYHLAKAFAALKAAAGEMVELTEFGDEAGQIIRLVEAVWRDKTATQVAELPF